MRGRAPHPAAGASSALEKHLSPCEAAPHFAAQALLSLGSLWRMLRTGIPQSDRAELQPGGWKTDGREACHKEKDEDSSPAALPWLASLQPSVPPLGGSVCDALSAFPKSKDGMRFRWLCLSVTACAH